ncbi:MAG: phosphatase PAP2 family protein [Nannocystaceae bacterium]|nr:phosphatase PAP2 family protein [Nannocystaceae bacterium]
MRLVLLTMLALVAVSLGFPGVAQASPGCKTGSAEYERAQFGLDLGLTAGSMGASAIGLYGVTQAKGGQWVPAIDRRVPVDSARGTRTASDVFTFGAYGLAVGWAVYATVRCRNEYTLKRSRATPLMELVWPWMWTVGVTEFTKSFAGRPRPYTRGSMGISEKDDDYRSFFSGHTSTASAVMTVTVSSGLRFAPRLARPLPRVLISAGAGLSYGFLSGIMRVQAARHHWSDVLVGASVGTAIGLLPIATELFGRKRNGELRTLRASSWPGGRGGSISGRF